MADLKKNEIKNSSVLSVRICVIGIKPMSFQPFSIQYYNSEMTYAFYIHFSWHFGMFYINLQQKWQRIYISSAVAMGLMSNKEIKDFTIKLEEGLRIAIERYRHNEPYTVIAGYAGTGKSTLIRFIIEALDIDPE